MAFLGKRSLTNLSQGCWPLQKVVQRAITKINFSIIDCYRGRDEQDAAFKSGKSKAKYGQSPHNKNPARAVDIIPCPFNGWDDVEGFRELKQVFVDTVEELKAEGELPDHYELEFGFDWGWDMPHIEEKNWRNV